MLNINQYARQWTEGSIFCYKRGCNCQGCYVKDIIETRCQMKRAVFELVRKFGKPPEDEEKGFFDNHIKNCFGCYKCPIVVFCGENKKNLI